MLKNIIPEYFYEYLEKTPIEKINEIRLRMGRKAVITINTKSYYISNNGLTGNFGKAVDVSKQLIDEIVKRACENSVYAYNHQIKNSFITVRGGIRIGLSGEVVYEKGNVKTLKNIYSLSIRIPHEIKGCASNILPYLIGTKGFLNTLIISPPGSGKTTLIRDIIYQLSKNGYCYNVLLADERFEIANSFNGCPTLDVGNFCDVLSGGSKSYAFENGIRSLRPDIIVTDEISNIKDYESIDYASSCGVSILTSVHAESIDDLKYKKDFENLLKNKVFRRFIVLSQKEGPGTLEGIYDENLRYINI